MDMRQLEIIRAIVETGSFTAAGEKLHVAQSAISRQILLLEEELGEPVFYRIGRRVRITPTGDAVLKLSNRVFQDVQDTLALISDQQESLKGTLRLVGGMTVCLYVFPAVLAELQRVNHQLDLKITAGSSEKCVNNLRSGIADLGLLTLPLEAPDLISVPVAKEELLLVMEPKHPLARQRKIYPSELEGQSFVLFERGSNTRRLLDDFFLKEGLEPQIVMETENVEIIKAMVRTALGVAIIPYQSVVTEVMNGQLCCNRIVGHQLTRETGWIYPKTSRLPRTVAEVLKAFNRVQSRFQFSPGLSVQHEKLRGKPPLKT